MTARSHVRLMPTPTKRLAMPLLLVGCLALSVQSAEPIDIGSRRELFVDDYLVDKLTGQAELYAHKPVPEEVVLVADAPWEGNVSGYFTVFQDGDLYRMYYRGWHFDEKTRRMARPEVTCYAESKDGIEWTKPKLGVVEFNGSKENNIVHKGLGSHNFTPFLDTNPDCKPPQRYKAMGSGKGGLFAFQSPDGIRWSPLGEKPVITRGAFDSQNLAFWDATRHCYVDFHRGFRDGIRDIMTATSADFSQWSEPVWLEYPGAPKEHLYTNAIRTYERAPHILVGFPTRFHPQRGQQVEPIFMTSRDGRTFRRWTDALIPVTAPKDRDGNRSNYMAWGLLKLPGSDKEYSVYATEAYYTGAAGRLRRFTYRIDGFVSVRAAASGGELVTKPIVFDGKQLELNVSVAAGGSIRVELQDQAGNPLPGYALADGKELTGDEIDAVYSWESGPDVSSLAGKPIRLRLVLKHADLYALRFK